MKNGLKVATFRERITELVESSGKSQSDIAADLGISKQTLSAWITGQNSPRIPTVTALATYFGVTVPWLNGFDVAKYDVVLPVMKETPSLAPSLSDDEMRLLDAWRAADDRAREDALKTLLGHPRETAN